MVLPAYQRQGIGRNLLEQAISHFPGIYQLHLLTDNAEKTRSFYEALGFTAVDSLGCVAYTYLKIRNKQEKQRLVDQPLL